MIPPDENAEFVAAMERVLEVYQRPEDPKRPVVAMDERPVQLLEDLRAPVPVKPGRIARRDYEYKRIAVVSAFLFTNPLQGWRRVAVRERRTAIDWAEEVKYLLDEVYPEAQLSNYKINLIFKSLANLIRISKAFDSIRPEKLPRNNIERAKEQKRFIDSHEALIFETEDSLQNIYSFLNTLKVSSKDNIFMAFFKKIVGPYVAGKVTDEVIEQAVVWMQNLSG